LAFDQCLQLWGGFADDVVLKPLAHANAQWNTRIADVLHGQCTGRGRDLQLAVGLSAFAHGPQGELVLQGCFFFTPAQGGLWGGGPGRGCSAEVFAGEQLALSAGLDVIGLIHQVRGLGQRRKSCAGVRIRLRTGRSGFAFRPHALDVALGIQRHLFGQLSDAGLDFGGLRLLLESLAFLRHVGVLALEI
jgi:hypothetical protein